jgi:hydroxyethylthiazole kinase
MINTKNHQKYLHKLRTTAPLILCLTNTVTITDCANGLLAIGAAPVMSEDPSDATALAALASALVINIGTINDHSQAVMEAAAEAAAKRKIPIVLDPVGAGASQRRMQASKLLAKAATVIRGNASEIEALCGQSGTQRGVDSSSTSADDLIIDQAKKLALDSSAIVAVSGKADFITNGQDLIKVEGGTPLLTKLTGTGCLLSVIVGAYVGSSPQDQLRAATAAHMHMARAAERAQENLERPMDLGTFKVNLFNELALLEGSDLDQPKGTGQWRLDA